MLVENPYLPADKQDIDNIPADPADVPTRKTFGKSPDPVIGQRADRSPGSEIQNIQPIPESIIHEDLNFHKALDQMMLGNNVTRREWNDKNWYCALKDYKLQIHKNNGQWADWIISDGDIMGTDWVVLAN